jgi:hypothetical protein
MGLVTSPPTHCYLECFGAIFCCQIFVVGHHTKVVIYSVSLSLSLSPLRQQQCLKDQRRYQWSSHTQGGCIARIVMSLSTGTEQPHKRIFTA